MSDAAVAWAGSVLGSRVVAHERLTGGMTSTMLALRDATGRDSVLRLMTEEPWRSHGAALTLREREAQQVLAGTPVPAPTSLGVGFDVGADGDAGPIGVAAHLMTRLPGAPLEVADDRALRAMADMLTVIHAVRPEVSFRTFESWAWEAKWVIPAWARSAESWQRAFDLLAGPTPAYEPTLLHRDYSHRNLLWVDGEITGVVDWVETSTGPAWLDAAHAATNLAVALGPDPAARFLDHYGTATGQSPVLHWLVMDAVGFLPPPGRAPMFSTRSQLGRLDTWLDMLVRGAVS